MLTSDLADRLAGVALGHVTREFPNKLDHVLTGAEDVRGPRDLHQVFYGSFDWHSCVHGYWMLAYLYRRFPSIPSAPAIRALFDAHMVAKRVAAECDYLNRPSAAGFERPYGWAWLLKLAAELTLHDTSEGRAWSATLSPLAGMFAALFMRFLPLATYPVRAGVHTNTAFAIRMALDYPDAGLRALLTDTARRWYTDDTECQAWEPGGDEFLSPALIEAECMRAALPQPRIPLLVRRIPAAARSTPAGDLVHTCNGQRPERWQDRASRRTEPEPRVVLARAGRFHAGSRVRTANGPGSYRCQSAACQRGVYGRTLAGELCHSRAAVVHGRVRNLRLTVIDEDRNADAGGMHLSLVFIAGVGDWKGSFDIGGQHGHDGYGGDTA
jgi:hypothetical protein